MRLLCFFAIIGVIPAQDIVGVVVDELSGLPVPGAAIRLYSDGMPGGRMPPRWVNASSGGDGKFVFAKVAAGKYSLDCSKLGYLTEERSFRGASVEVKADGSVDPALVRIRLMPEAILGGRLLTEDGKPIAGAVVKPLYGSQSASTDKTGAFELTGLRDCEKDCKLRVEIQELTRRLLLVKTDNKTLGPPDWVDKTVSPWIAGQQVRNLELRVANVPLVSFAGVVTNAPENTTVEIAREGAQPTYFGEPLKGGKLAFELLPVGDYRLLFRKAMDLRSAPVEVAVRIDADLMDQKITLPKPLSITGVVRLNGKPFYQPGYQISMSQQSPGSYRSAQGEIRPDGTFEVLGVSPGKWFVGSSYSGRSDQKQTMNFRVRRFEQVEIVNGENAPLVVELVQTVTFAGRILDAEGLPVAGSVILKGSADTAYFPSDRFGNFGSGLLPGTYEVTAWRSGDAADARNLPTCPTARTMTINEDLPKLEVRVCR